MTDGEVAGSGRDKGGLHRGWIMLIVIGLYYATVSGLMVNCIGIVFAAILEDTGYKASELSIYYSVRFIFSAFAARPLIAMFDRSKRPNVYMAVTGVLAALGFAMMPFFTRVWHWYISSVLVSVSAAGMAYIVSVTINNWFSKNQGMITGFTFMSSGISAALLGPVFSSIIESCGWRACCFTIAGISVVSWILPCLFLMVRSPEEIGLRPVWDNGGRTTTQSNGGSDEQHTVPSEAMWLILALGISLPQSVAMINNQLPTFAVSEGYELSLGATISSCCMIGNTAFKPFLGLVSDRIGAIKALKLHLALAAAGITCIMCAQTSPFVICAGGALYGAIFGCTVTAPSLVCREVYGDAAYKERLSRLQPISTTISAVTSFAYPEMYEILGTWTPVFALCVAFCLLAITALTIAQVDMKKRHTISGVSQRA